MTVWLFKQLGIPVSYSVGAKIPFGDMGTFVPGSEYFVYECDEFDRNFLAFHPHLSLITGVSWDHHEIFPKREDYQDAFRDFLDQSSGAVLWDEDARYLELEPTDTQLVLDTSTSDLANITIAGEFNRRDGRLAIQTMHKLADKPISELVELLNSFPGLQRRMETIRSNLYSDYAHTPEKIRGCMSVAQELSNANKQNLIVVYEPLTNRRQHYMMDDYGDCFAGAQKVYWVPSYLAREDPNLAILTPAELISRLADPSIAAPAQMDDDLRVTIQQHLDNGDMVVCMTGGGGGSLDEWLRHNFQNHN